MIRSGLFLGCLVASVAIHGAFLIALPYRNAQSPKPKKIVEVSYERSLGPKAKAQLQEYAPALKEKPKTPTVSADMQDFIKKEIFKEASAIADTKNPFEKKEDIAFKKLISMPSIPGETAKSPEYKDYYQIIREKIRRYAYSNYKRLQEGRVFLTFSLRSDGKLIDAKVNAGKSSKNEYLREIALKSVTDAAPFQEFPAKLKNNDALSFNVIISFELRK